MMDSYTVDTLHRAMSAAMPKPCTFDSQKPFEEQRNRIESRYTELLKMPSKEFKATPVIEYKKTDNKEYDEIRFKVETEENFFVPAHMLLPKSLKSGDKAPAVICLQGHSTGMHISIGRPIYPNDQLDIDGDRDFALQAVRRGYIAIAMEQRGLGELRSEVHENMCHQLAFECLMVGRTLLGERIHDIRCMVDALESFENVDCNRIGIMGNSGGGTSSYHAACVEKRIKVIMPSCAFNTYQASIMAMHHCACNYIPGIELQMEMPDLALMIAPRPLIIINGREDPIFPLNTALTAFKTVQDIYRAEGHSQNCRQIIGNGGHRFYSADAWPVFDQFI